MVTKHRKQEEADRSKKIRYWGRCFKGRTFIFLSLLLFIMIRVGLLLETSAGHSSVELVQSTEPSVADSAEGFAETSMQWSLQEEPEETTDLISHVNQSELPALSQPWMGYPEIPVTFPGLPAGRAWLTNGSVQVLMRSDESGTEVSSCGRYMTIPVQWGDDNAGVMALCFESGTHAQELPSGWLHLSMQRPIPSSGDRIHIGDAVVAVSHEPPPGSTMSSACDSVLSARIDPFEIVNRTEVNQWRRAAHIVRIPLWAGHEEYACLSFELDVAAQTVSGNLISSEPYETLRYISSETQLPESYVPALQLTRKIPGIATESGFRFHPEALMYLRMMMQDALDQGIRRWDLDNSYRSDEWQNRLFERRLKLNQQDPDVLNPLEETLHRVARPGGSEHQTGLAFDMYAYGARGEAFSQTPQYEWLNEEGWKYGFTVRYPAGAEKITGIMFEPWHIRYFGRPVAAHLKHCAIAYEQLAAMLLVKGAVWLETPDEDEATTRWLAVLANSEAAFSSFQDSLAPQIYAFLPESDLWLLPMTEAPEIE